jgi:hypothetical protein
VTGGASLGPSPARQGALGFQLLKRSETGPSPRGQRIVVTTLGSLGDLRPYSGADLGLQAQGHEAVMATSACYREEEAESERRPQTELHGYLISASSSS